MRRAGKTTYLWQLMAQRLKAGTPREGINDLQVINPWLHH
jgi:hypothetical protein